MSPAKDEAEAINLLSLDGGGVRGVSSLLILHEIMVQIKEARGLERIPKPCEYFHMIAGTSTGGLIAIMLGRLRMSTEEALQEYNRCAGNVFSLRNFKWTTLTEKFRATALKDAVEDLVRRRNMGEYLMEDGPKHDAKGQCFVCVMPADRVGEPRRLASFLTNDKLSQNDLKIWEAARATTAASYYFKPMPLTIGKCLTEEYIDAAIGCNNPVEYLLHEAANRIGTARRLGCVLSIGTGTRPVKIERASTGLRNLMHTPKFGKALIGTLKNTATSGGGEETHRRVLARLADYPDSYFRFNVPNAADLVGLDEYRKLKSLETATEGYVSEPLVATQVLKAASVLARNSSEHGMTVGLAAGMDKDQVILTTQEARPPGDISRFFTARDDILDRLDACFSPRDTRGKPRREFLLYGMGGVGKTQIALKAADQLEDRFEYFFHVDGTSPVTVNQSYANICQQYCDGYRQPGPMARVAVEEMKAVALKWMEGLTDEWLMLYDNHPERDRLEPVLPRRNSGNVIYTCRSKGPLTDLLAECACEVKPLAEDDAIKLLLKVAGREHLGLDKEEISAAQKTVAEVGYLPLAVDNIGAYLRTGSCSALTYLQRFRGLQARPELLRKPNADGSSPARPALYNAFDLSYDAIAGVRRREGAGIRGTAAECALRLLNLLCFYHNEEIPIRMIKCAAEERASIRADSVYPFCDLVEDSFMDPSFLLAVTVPDGAWNPTPFRLGVQMLEQFSLIKLSSIRNTLSMHVLVQAWAQEKMVESTRCQQALVARIVLIESVKLGADKFEQAWSRALTPHIDACMSHEATSITDDGYQAALNFKLGWFYKHQKQFPDAVEYLTNAVRLWKLETGPESGSTTLGLSVLGQVYHEMGRIGDAKLIYFETLSRLSLRLDVHNANSEARNAQESRATERARRRVRRLRMARLASFSETIGRSKGKKADRGVEQAERCQPLPERGSLESVTGQAGPTQAVTDPKDQRAQDFQAVLDGLFTEEETSEEWRREVAGIHADLARVFFDEGKSELGSLYLSEAIEEGKIDDGFDIEIQAWEDELKWRSKNTDVGYWKRRLAVLEEGLSQEELRELVGFNGDFVLLMGLADTYMKHNLWEAAYEIYEDRLRRAPEFYGPGDRKTLDLMRFMAMCQTRRGFFEDGERLARTALERSRAFYGNWHFQTANCLYTLVDVLFHTALDVGPGSEYRTILQEAYDSVRHSFREEHAMARHLKILLEGPAVKARDLGEAVTRKSNRTVQEVLVKVLTRGGSKSPEEYMEKLSLEYRERMWERSQAQPIIRGNGGPGIGSQGLAEAESSSHATTNRGGLSTDFGTERPWVPERQTKSKKEEKTPASPMSVMEEIGAGCLDNRSDNMIRSEEFGIPSPSGTWELEHEINLGADWSTPGKPWIRIWESKDQDGKLDLMVTGAVIGHGEPRWRVIESWDDFEALLEPPIKAADETG